MYTIFSGTPEVLSLTMYCGKILPGVWYGLVFILAEPRGEDTTRIPPLLDAGGVDGRELFSNVLPATVEYRGTGFPTHHRVCFVRARPMCLPPKVCLLTACWSTIRYNTQLATQEITVHDWLMDGWMKYSRRVNGG